MAEYTDNLGRRWRVTLTVSTIERIREETGVDLMVVAEGSLSAALQRDVVATANALFIASEPMDRVEAVRRKLSLAIASVTPGRVSLWFSRYAGRSFKRGFDGEAVERACTALMEGIIDFFQPARRNLLRAIWLKTREAEDSASSRLVSGIMSQPAIAGD